ncbi:Dabb family protein [Vibrio hannami]|uniref:Dabb family protein n=1 Tax=Vibrio hannami TaxID=2717094 RepID=UPI00240F3605|nr:Dabb family protein [Vibrio hannami]MDG3085402.1 Dabb family protein [Vibrio hannami]
MKNVTITLTNILLTIGSGVIRHILLIKFKETAPQQEIEKLEGLFIDMPDKVEGVVSVEWGINDSPENKNKDYTHTVFMTFADEAGRQNYLPHPEHNALKQVFRPLLEDIIVFDYQV